MRDGHNPLGSRRRHLACHERDPFLVPIGDDVRESRGCRGDQCDGHEQPVKMSAHTLLPVSRSLDQKPSSFGGRARAVDRLPSGLEFGRRVVVNVAVANRGDRAPEFVRAYRGDELRDAEFVLGP